DGVPVVGDLKSGFLPVTTAEENLQVGVFAIAKRILLGADIVEVRIWKLRPDGRIWPDTYELTAFDLDGALDELEEGVDRGHAARRHFLAHGWVNVSEGDHCRYCPSMAACPAKQALARAMLSEVEPVGAMGPEQVREYVKHLPLADAGAALVKVKRIEQLAEVIRKALNQRAVQEWLPTAPGKVARPIAFDRQSFSQEAAVALLKELGATDAQIGGLYKTYRQEQIRETN